MAHFHVRVTSKSSSSQAEVELDLSLEELTERFLRCYENGLPIVIAGKTILSDDIERIQINATVENSTHVNQTLLQRQKQRNVLVPVDHQGRLPLRILASQGDDVTSRYITGPPGGNAGATTQDVSASMPSANLRDVFVVHGRNLLARDALFEFLRAIDLHPLEWSEAVKGTGKPSPYIGDILDSAFLRAQAVVVLFTPDDEARLREPLWGDNEPPQETKLTGQARPNVLFEAGMAMGRSEDRTVLVELGTLRPFSDVAGRHVVRLNDSTERRQELAQRLEAAGCPVNFGGTGWHKTGDFEAAIAPFEHMPSVSETTQDHSTDVLEAHKLSEEAIEILIEAAKDSNGTITRIRSFGGLSIVTNDKSFVESGDPRTEAKWEQAIRGLLDQGSVEDPVGDGRVFSVTHIGFETADSLEISK